MYELPASTGETQNAKSEKPTTSKSHDKEQGKVIYVLCLITHDQYYSLLHVAPKHDQIVVTWRYLVPMSI